MSDEREILACSLPPEEGSAAAEFEKKLLPKQPGCPLTADLILLAEGKAAPDMTRHLEGHLEECAACLASFQGFQRVLEPQGALVRAVPCAPARPGTGRFSDTLPVPATAGNAAGSDWDSVVHRIGSLFAGGASAGQLLEQTGLGPRTVLDALCEAWQRQLIGGPHVREPVSPGVAAPLPPAGEPKSLLDLLQARSPHLRNVTVRQSRDPAAGAEGKGTWDERIRYFGCEVAPLLVSLLSQSSYAGVAWGRTVTAAISAVQRACEAPPARPRGPLVCVSTVGGLVGELKVRAESSSSILASRLAEAINGDWEDLYTLHGLEAFISFLDSSDEIDTIRKRISRFPNYQAIFGGPSQPGVIDRLDAIVTSCGDAHHYNDFWTTELPRIGVSPEKLNSLTHGNIGGVLLEREDLEANDRALFADIARRWTGITRQHYEQCVQRKPGVILLALGHNKADVVLRCVELGLVTELIIDEDLAMALWGKVDPQNRYPRTLEAVLCRQVPLEQAG
jgi:DNA-binding transcriptional regulator LsrR (DeoR family)